MKTVKLHFSQKSRFFFCFGTKTKCYSFDGKHNITVLMENFQFWHKMWFYYFGTKTWFCSFGEKYNFAVLRENFNLWVWQKIWFSFWQDKKFEDLTRERDFTILAKQIYVILLFCQRKWFIVFEGRHNIVVWTEIVILQFLLENVRVWHEIMIFWLWEENLILRF